MHCPTRITPMRRFRVRIRLLTAAVAACYVVAPAWALPTDPLVQNGTAAFDQSGKVLNVTNSNGAIIHWNSFSIAAGETTRFIQPAASSSVLNRVVGADPSLIYGTLTSNGRVWLINPSGIMVGAGGRIDTAGFVAATLHVANQDFLAGRLSFQDTPGAGDVINRGRIVTPSGGTVYLVGANVGNEGIITTPDGETLLAAGKTVDLIDTATPGVRVEITGAAGNVTNLGEIAATAGRIGMAGVIVRNSGQINASSVVADGGRVFLKASKEAYVDGAGRIVATGRRGGSIAVLGERVAVTDQAALDASGTDAGGTVLVGGDLQGGNAAVPNAAVSYFGPQATIHADATGSGDGGKVVIWADDTARAFGRIYARGGAGGGNGGFVETSGHRYLDVAGIRVDTSATAGAAGNWLLDPTDVTIVAGSSGATFTGGIFDNGGGASATVYAGDIGSNLAGGNVTISTASASSAYGDIAMSAGAVIQPGTGLGERTLSLNADRNIAIAYGAAILGNAGTRLNVVANAASGGVALNGGIATYGGAALVRGQSVTVGDGINTAQVGINATTDFIAATDSTTPDSAPGGRILVDARGGIFTLAAGAGIATSNRSTVRNADGQIDSYGGVAIGIVAGDVVIDPAAKGIKLDYSGGGGDLGFIPTSASIGLGVYGGASFTLDNVELGQLHLPAGGNASCGTGAAGCRIWIGNSNPSSDPLVGPLPFTSQPIVVDQADFTAGGPKRVQLSTSGTIDDNGTGAVGGYYGIQAGHIGVSGAAGIGSAGGDGLSFIANSAGFSAYAGSVLANSVGSGDLALRNVEAFANATLGAAGAVVLLPHNASQREAVGGSFALNAGGDVTFAGVGQTFALKSSAYGSTVTYSDTAGATAMVSAAAIDIVSQGSISVTGHHMSGAAANFTAYGAGISFTAAGVNAQGSIGINAPNGDIAFYGGTTDTTGTFVHSTGNMALAAGKAIVLQAGSANGTQSGYGAGVSIFSDGAQTLAAKSISLYGGATGHDNFAHIIAFGDQSIAVQGGALTLAGGGDSSSSVYGGAGSFNNSARIDHGTWNNGTVTGSGNQTITVHGGGAINLTAGNGTGSGSHYGSDCVSAGFTVAQCSGGNNGAGLSNGSGDQTLAFVSGGSITAVGGLAGRNNSADISNHRDGGAATTTPGITTQTITGAPNIALYGGGAGSGAFVGSYGGKIFTLANGAGIDSDDGQVIAAGAVYIDGGASAYGGAGLSAAHQSITTTGDVTLVGGSAALIAGSAPTAPAYIGSEHAADLALAVGGTLNVSGNQSGALVGSFMGHGGAVAIAAGTDINLDGTAVTHAPGFAPSAAMNVTLAARRDVSLGRSILDAHGGKIAVVAGWDGLSTTQPALATTAPSGGMGGSIVLKGTVLATSGTVSLGATGSIGDTDRLSAVVAATLDAVSRTGLSLTGANAVAAFGGSNAAAGDIVLNNIANPLTITGVSNAGGKIVVANIGGISTTGAITAANGGVSLTAHSPIDVGSSIVAGAGDIELGATSGVALTASASLSAPAGSVRASTTAGTIVVPVGATVSVGSGGAIVLTAAGGSANMDLRGEFIGAVPTVVDSLQPTPVIPQPPQVIAQVVEVITQTIAATTASSTSTETTTVAAQADILPLATSGSGSNSLSALDGQTIGGSTGEFGAAVTTDAAPVASAADAGDMDIKTQDSKDGKDGKDGKENKDDKKSADTSREKKDDKASGKKPVGKCSA